MATVADTSDAKLLDLLRSEGSMSVLDLGLAMEVTATAVRQRLARLMADDLVDRQVQRAVRGRPSHRYSLTEKARRQVGGNFADLAMILWNEIRAIGDPAVRLGLLQRLAKTMAQMYRPLVDGLSTSERMRAVADLFADRGIPMEVDESSQLPVLRALECPYPELAEQDRGICAMEQMMLSELLESDVRLSLCRLDGGTCCEFQSS